MTPEQLHVYTEETLIHAQLALSNYQTFLNVLAGSETRQRREAWMFLQSFLSHFGMVSKLLYAPSGSRRAENRAKELRAYLGFDRSSALNDRNARNAIEHLDERIDNWLEVPDKGVIESVFKNREEYGYLPKKNWFVRRAFIIEGSVFIVEERSGPKEMELQPLSEELGRLCEACQEKLKLPGPYEVINPC
jgi:hypothetical protein